VQKTNASISSRANHQWFPMGMVSGAASSGQVKVFDATVVRVWSGDQVSVLGKDDGKERRLYLSSIRAPKYDFSDFMNTDYC
jgi:endonuclease YncB( thermonuclease family)